MKHKAAVANWLKPSCI